MFGAPSARSELAVSRYSDALEAATNRLALWALRLLLQLPYRHRIAAGGWLVARIVAPLAGWNARVRENLARVRPDLDPGEVRRLSREVPRNVGRAVAEIFSGPDFVDRVKDTPLSGPGVPAFLQARRTGRPVVFVTAHLGNFDALRAVMVHRGEPLAALYRPMRNPVFHDRYITAMESIGGTLFASDRRGVVGFVRHLSRGGVIGILIDLYEGTGAPLTFFGERAWTTLSAASWAVERDALCVPIYGIRRPDGLSFVIWLDAPIAHGPSQAMTQALNDSLERVVRAHMDQWFWVHRRWKKGRRGVSG